MSDDPGMSIELVYRYSSETAVYGFVTAGMDGSEVSRHAIEICERVMVFPRGQSNGRRSAFFQIWKPHLHVRSFCGVSTKRIAEPGQIGTMDAHFLRTLPRCEICKRRLEVWSPDPPPTVWERLLEG